AGGAGQLELAAHQLGAEGAAPGRVDPRHDRLDVLVLARPADEVGRRQAPDRAGRRAAVDDLAFGDDDADGVAAEPRLDPRQIVVKRDLAKRLLVGIDGAAL